MLVQYIITIIMGLFLPCLVDNIHTMAIHGLPQIRYDPCGLGVVHIDKVWHNGYDNIWKAVLNLGLYPELHEADIKIVFGVPVTLMSLSYVNLANYTNEYNWTLKFLSAPQQYVFLIKVGGNRMDELPKVQYFYLNTLLLCNENDEAMQKIESLNVTGDMDTGKYKHICGRRFYQNTELTTTSAQANPGDWPWHVALFITQLNNNKAEYQCGGNIISTRAIVTAGHCLNKEGVSIDTNRIILIAGTTDLINIDAMNSQTRRAKEVILHPSYNDVAATADLAVIKVDPFIFTKYVQPICLWGSTFNKTQLFGVHGVIAGFGITENNTFSSVLRSTRIVVQSDVTCVAFSPKLYQSLLNEFTFCAGYGPTVETIPRNGDSGGGFILPTLQPDHKLSWFLRGVLSKCVIVPGNDNMCDTKYYVVYTDTGPHYAWLMYHADMEYSKMMMRNVKT